MDTSDSPSPKLSRWPQEEEHDIDMSEGETEMASVIMVNMLPPKSENSQLPATSHNLLSEDPPATMQPEPQPDCLVDPVHDEPPTTSPVLVRPSQRTTTGHHTNPFNLPQSVCRPIENNRLALIIEPLA